MQIECGGKRYELIVGSDIVDDGMFLEAREVGAPMELLLYAFWSDADGSFTFSAHKQDLPFALVEAFVEMAREHLPDRTFEQQE